MTVASSGHKSSKNKLRSSIKRRCSKYKSNFIKALHSQVRLMAIPLLKDQE